MKVALGITIALAAGMTVLSCAGGRVGMRKPVDGPASTIEPFTKVTLKNGLDVIVKEVHSAPIVAVYFWCNTGSVNESERIWGISHFYEHMFFKGTEKRGVGEIDRAVKALGGYNNAFTSQEYTAYYVVLPSENFSLAADVLADAIKNSKFPDDEIKKELGVITEEINRKEDDPTGKLYEELFKIMFPGTPYAHPVLGTKESISGLTREDFKSYLAKFYVPNNMTAVVVGDVKTRNAIDEIERLTKDWKPNPEIDKKADIVMEDDHGGIRGFTLEKDVNMSYVVLAFKTSGLSDPRENAVMDAVSTMLGEGRSSRLYKRIVEKEQIANSVSAFIHPMRHAGIIAVTGTMDRENVPRFRDVVLDEIAKLGKEPTSGEELAKSKSMLKADFAFGNETDSDIAGTLGYYNISGMLERASSYERTIDSVTPDEVMMFSKRVLTPDSYTMGIINQRIPLDREVQGE